MTDHPGPAGPLHSVVDRAVARAEPSGGLQPHPPVGALEPRPPVPGAPEREGSRPGEQGTGVFHTPAEPEHRVVHSPGERPRVVLVHGFTQTLAAWGPVAERLARRWEVVRVDLPGHGGSGHIRAGFVEAARLVGETGGAGVYVGYSLGGRLCLRLALDRPDLVRGLVLVGASPGIADPTERAGRRAADQALAAGIEREGVAAFLDRWLAGPLFATLPAEAAGRAERLANTAPGLASALRELGTGAQEPLWDRLPTLGPPVLLVAGELDAKFAAITGQMAAAIGPHARVALVSGAGHAVPLERPAELAALVEELLDAGRPAAGA